MIQLSFKECNLCQKNKPLSFFAKDRLGKMGRRSKCKECDNKIRASRRLPSRFGEIAELHKSLVLRGYEHSYSILREDILRGRLKRNEHGCFGESEILAYLKTNKNAWRKKLIHLGKRYNNLVVVGIFRGNERYKSGGIKRFCLVRCDCGNESIKILYHVVSGGTKSCGCRPSTTKETRLVHFKGYFVGKLGKLTILSIIKKDLGQSKYLCKCDCGKECIKTHKQLRRSKYYEMSCGCLVQAETNKIKKGEKYGKLTVICKTNEKASSGSYKIKCVCDCGNVVLINKNSLFVNGTTPSCGCYRKEYALSFVGTKASCLGDTMRRTGLPREEIPPKLVELKARGVQINRKLKELT